MHIAFVCGVKVTSLTIFCLFGLNRSDLYSAYECYMHGLSLSLLFSNLLPHRIGSLVKGWHISADNFQISNKIIHFVPRGSTIIICIDLPVFTACMTAADVESGTAEGFLKQ